MRIVCEQTILMKYHALFVIFEKVAKFEMSSAANNLWCFMGKYGETGSTLIMPGKLSNAYCFCGMFPSVLKATFSMEANSMREHSGSVGRVLDSRLRSSRFEPHWHHCVVSLSKTHLSLLSTDSTQEGPSQRN